MIEDEVEIDNMYGYVEGGVTYRAWGLSVKAVNEIVARQKARVFVRKKNWSEVSIFNVSDSSLEGEVDTQLTDFWPDRLSRNVYDVTVEFSR